MAGDYDGPVLELRAGAPAPTIQFGEVAPRAPSTRTFLVRNDANKSQRIELKSRLETRDALRVYPVSVELAPSSSKEISITWAPTTVGSALAKKLELVMNGGTAVLEVRLKGQCTKEAKAAPVSAAPAPAAVVRVKRAAAAGDAIARAPLSPNSANRKAAQKAAPTPLNPDGAAAAAGGKPTNFKAFLAQQRAAATSDGANKDEDELSRHRRRRRRL